MDRRRTNPTLALQSKAGVLVIIEDCAREDRDVGWGQRQSLTRRGWEIMGGGGGMGSAPAARIGVA